MSLSLDSKLSQHELKESLTNVDKPIQNLSLTGILLSEASVFEALKQCIQSNPLISFSLAYTVLLAPRLNPLLEILSKQSTLESVTLRSCFVSESSREQICKLISDLPTLSELDLTNHAFTHDKEIDEAILASQSLTKIDGLKLSPSIQLHLDQNKRFQFLTLQLNKLLDDQNLSKERLDCYKVIIYNKVKEIQAQQQHQSNRLNQFLVNFYKLLANCYQRLNDLDSAKTYLRRCLQINLNDAQRFEINMALGEMLYNEGFDLTRADVTRSPVHRKGNMLLMQALTHLEKAKQSAHAEKELSEAIRLESYCSQYLAEDSIEMGEDLLDSINEESSFKRRYKKRPS